MQKRLLPEVVSEHRKYRRFYRGEHFLRVAAVGTRHGLHHILKHEDVFDFGYFRHKNMLSAQIFHFLLVAAVAVHYAEAFKMVERTQVVEGACRFDYLIAASERFNRKISEYQRIQLGVDRVG